MLIIHESAHARLKHMFDLALKHGQLRQLLGQLSYLDGYGCEREDVEHLNTKATLRPMPFSEDSLAVEMLHLKHDDLADPDNPEDFYTSWNGGLVWYGPNSKEGFGVHT